MPLESLVVNFSSYDCVKVSSVILLASGFLSISKICTRQTSIPLRSLMPTGSSKSRFQKRGGSDRLRLFCVLMATPMSFPRNKKRSLSVLDIAEGLTIQQSLFSPMLCALFDIGISICRNDDCSSSHMLLMTSL